MKKFAKIALLVTCAVALVVCSILGTLAYLKYTTQVTQNTFTVGNVVIALDEAKVNAYGADQGTRTVVGNEYKLIPDHTYVKDPTVTVAAGSEESYVRMIVTVTDYADVLVAFGDDFALEDIFNDWGDGWTLTGDVSVADNVATFEYRYNGKVTTTADAGNKLPALFKSFTIPGDIDSAALANLAGEGQMSINVVAHAIQADGFDGANAAWAAYAEETANN